MVKEKRECTISEAGVHLRGGSDNLIGLCYILPAGCKLSLTCGMQIGMCCLC